LCGGSARSGLGRAGPLAGREACASRASCARAA